MNASESDATQVTVTNRRAPFPAGFMRTISEGWAERPELVPPRREQADYAAARRAAVSAA